VVRDHAERANRGVFEAATAAQTSNLLDGGDRRERRPLLPPGERAEPMRPRSEARCPCLEGNRRLLTQREGRPYTAVVI
jgi:hypothetical protein